MSNAERREGKLWNRREVLGLAADFAQSAGIATIAGYAGAKDVNEALALIPTSSEITFSPEQQVRLEQQRDKKDGPKQAVLVLGGLTVKDPKNLTEVLSPSLGLFGPVGSVNYGANEVNAESIVTEMARLQELYKIDEFSFWGNSIGLHPVGEIMQIAKEKKLLRPFRVNRVFADCSPPATGYGDNPEAEKFLSGQQFQHEPLIPLIISLSYGTPLKREDSPANLFWDQVRESADERYLFALQERLKQDKGTLIFLTPEDPSADKVVDSARSQARLEEIFTERMRTYKIGGYPQAHANAEANIAAYSAVIKKEYILAA